MSSCIFQSHKIVLIKKVQTMGSPDHSVNDHSGRCKESRLNGFKETYSREEVDGGRQARLAVRDLERFYVFKSAPYKYNTIHYINSAATVEGCFFFLRIGSSMADFSYMYPSLAPNMVSCVKELVNDR